MFATHLPNAVRCTAVQVLLLSTAIGLASGGAVYADSKKSLTKSDAAKTVDEKWNQHTMEEMTISLPSSAQKIPGNEQLPHYWAAAKENKYAFLVMVLARPDNTKTGIDDSKLLENTNKLVTSSILDANLVEGPKGGDHKTSIKAERSLTLGEHQGKEWDEEVNGVPITMRAYIGKNFLYAVASIAAESGSQKQLFDSIAMSADKTEAKKP